MANCFSLSVMTAEGTVLEGRASYCHLPTTMGSVGILADHAPMLCALREGEVLCRMEDGTEKILKVSAGVGNVRENSVTILADRAELS